ncbi:putative 8-oxoguanine DNA glycosylase [Leptomonas seymouri]|uniref:DNA-(apurinic or apyrimidinic site) lyase n=1 Tax=Leptomonas seymouri TaxID=5684 RepID=A0A0N1I223_LEPSE|nr:putative 8-oxoguanine DNA glycosylase [Leptomonas seymouri]|eukprot:KPI90465.1 putative 8-oxoguanine DNA glycosylase [Leptomonas seymouri]
MAPAPRISSPAAWQVLRPSIHSKIDLRMTLCGGQCFHWYPTPRHTYVGTVGHQVFELREVHCPTEAAHAKKEGDKKRSLDKMPLHEAKTFNDASSEVYSWIEYRKLWPQHVMKQAIAGSADSHRLKPSPSPSPSSRSSLCAETDEEVLTRYLSLDVDLAALWRRWTDAPTTRQHPLVTYLMCHSEDATLMMKTEARRNGPLRKQRHDGGVPTATYIPIRHVRQDLHSCLFSFLCSQNNNVTRITTMIDTLSRQYGDHLCDVHLATDTVRPPYACNPSKSVGGAQAKTVPSEKSDTAAQHALPLPASSSKRSKKQTAEAEWLSVFSFPSIEQLAAASEEELRRLGFGYRSKYVVAAAKAVSSFSLTPSVVGEGTTTLPALLRRQHETCIRIPFYADLLAHCGDLAYQRKQLQSLCGVGRKVADCVLLFSLSHSNLVPVDTHIAQIAVEYLTASAPVPLQPLKGARKRSRPEEEGREVGEHEGGKGGATPWQKELLLWRAKAAQLKAKHAAPPVAQKGALKKNKSKMERGSSLAVYDGKTDAEVAETATLPVPPLYERHHDAIQHGFTALFGSHAGWAHSILFYYRMRK